MLASNCFKSPSKSQQKLLSLISITTLGIKDCSFKEFVSTSDDDNFLLLTLLPSTIASSNILYHADFLDNKTFGKFSLFCKNSVRNYIRFFVRLTAKSLFTKTWYQHCDGHHYDLGTCKRTSIK